MLGVATYRSPAQQHLGNNENGGLQVAREPPVKMERATGIEPAKSSLEFPGDRSRRFTFLHSPSLPRHAACHTGPSRPVSSRAVGTIEGQQRPVAIAPRRKPRPRPSHRPRACVEPLPDTGRRPRMHGFVSPTRFERLCTLDFVGFSSRRADLPGGESSVSEPVQIPSPLASDGPREGVRAGGPTCLIARWVGTPHTRSILARGSLECRVGEICAVR